MASYSTSGVPGLTPTQLRGQLVRNGWRVLPIVAHDAAHAGAGKAPGCRAWQQWAAYEAPHVGLDEVEGWRARECQWPGTGIACGNESTERAWKAFAASTVLNDGQWREAAARIKAAALLDRVRRRLVDLGSSRGGQAEPIALTYSDRRRPLAEAEAATRTIARTFFGEHVPAWKAGLSAWTAAADEAEESDLKAPARTLPVSWGARVEIAIGKTALAVTAAAAAAKAGLKVVYAVPTYRLATEIAARFEAEGIEARVYRGYGAADPEVEDTTMCLDLAAVQDAQEAGSRSVREAVCERKV